MSIKKSLLALAAAAMAMMAFASSAMATDGVLRDVSGTGAIEAGKVLHTVGWAKFTTAGIELECHMTLSIKSVGTTGTTGEVTAFTIPTTSNCTGRRGLAGCKVKTHESKNLPYHYTVTDTGRLDITGKIEIHDTYEGCLVRTTLLKIKEVQVTPLATGARTITGGTPGNAILGPTAVLNEAIAGFEIDGFTASGEALTEDAFGGKKTEVLASVTGEFELSDSKVRCTYEISPT